MTNEEASSFYVSRARKALARGEQRRALHHFHTAILHDDTNAEAHRGVEELEPIVRALPPEAGPDLTVMPSDGHRRRKRRRKRAWWKRMLAGVGLYRSR